MKNYFLILFLLLCSSNQILAQREHYPEFFLPNQIDAFQNKVLIVGHGLKGVQSVFLKNEHDTLFANIALGVDLELNVDSKVRFDNVGNIWAFGKHNIWKYENGEWNNISSNMKLLQNRYFTDFCFDNDNNIFVVTRIEFVRSREDQGGTIVKVIDSIHHEVLKINSNNFDFEVILNLYHKPIYAFNAITAITKRNDGAIACYIVGTSNNIFIYQNGVHEYKTVPIFHDHFRTIVSSIAFDHQMNLWIPVTSTYEFKEQGIANGVHKITASGQQSTWDTSNGLNGKRFNNQYEINWMVGVNKVICDDKTGLVWCGTNHGFFSIDESKQKNEQITTYNRDSIPKVYRKTIVLADALWPFIITDIALSTYSIFFVASQGALLEAQRNTMTSTTNENTFLISPVHIDVLPNPVIDNDMMIISLKNVEFMDDIHLTIMDVSGNAVQKMTILHISPEMQIPIHTNNLPKGTYFVRVNSGTTQLTKKFILN